MRSPSASRVASLYTSHPCMHGGPCQCGGGCGTHPEGESYMSVQALRSMKDHSEELLGSINEHSNLPDWVEAKLTEASSSLNDVYEYMAHGHNKKAYKRLNPAHFHVQYPNYRTIRLLVYLPGHSTFFEVPADDKAVQNLLTELANAGMTADPADIQEAIEMA